MLSAILIAIVAGLFSIVAYHIATYGRRGRRWGSQ